MKNEKNIKNFIEEGEKEFEEKYVVKSNAGTGLLRYTDADVIKRFISYHQISLIKMIVEMVESEKKEEVMETECHHCKGKPQPVRDDCLYCHSGMQAGRLDENVGFNQALDTILSKLKDLYK